MPKKGILMIPVAAPTAPPPPPPTSSIPKSKKPLVTVGLGHQLRGHRPDSLMKFEMDDMRQIHALNRRLASLTIADMSPRLALQRILLLYKKGDHREAAGFIRRLSYATFRQLVEDLPMEGFVEAMPQSLPILEAVYGKLFLGGNSNRQFSANVVSNLTNKYSPENVVWQIVKFFASQEEPNSGHSVTTLTTKPNKNSARWEMCGPWVSTCKRLLSVLLSADPRIKRIVSERRKALTKAIEGLGQHGLIGTSDESLLHLHDALRIQFDLVSKSYADALNKLEQLCLLSNDKPASKAQINSLIHNLNDKLGIGQKSSSPSGQSSSSQLLKSPPVAQSHQRQLSLKAHEIQERLIKNKSLLNAIEPTLENHSLEVLLGILQRRIDLDKEILFQFTQLKKEFETKSNGSNTNSVGKTTSVAPILMKYQRGCQQVGPCFRVIILFASSLKCSSSILYYNYMQLKTLHESNYQQYSPQKILARGSK